MKSRHWRTVLHGSFLAACVMAVWPPYAREAGPGPIRLGLDLRGGTYLVLQVEPDDIGRGRSRVQAETLKELMRVLERRVDQFGVADPVITPYGKDGDQILVQLPGVKDVEQAKRLLVSVAQLSLHLVERDAATREALLPRGLADLPPGLEVVPGQGGTGTGDSIYLLRHQPAVTGRDLKTARVGQDGEGRPDVEFVLRPRAAARFHEETAGNLGRRLAIVLDRRVMSAPVIEQAVGAEGQIRGRFTSGQADELAKVLRAGALPARTRVVQERTIGASLGRDSVRAGATAGAVAVVGVSAFMLAYYRGAGLNAVAALGANLLVLLAAMATARVTLTLPGMAGIVLTLGVGVDTNVLVFERIREELRAGRPVPAAVRDGFRRVWITILDTHATAVIAAAFLFQFGTGPVKGFAATLVIGLVANVFASYFLSRLLFDWVLARRDARELSI